MFVNDGPYAAINKMRAHIFGSLGTAPETWQPLLVTAATEPGVADAIVKGMETLFAFCVEEDEEPTRDASLSVLGHLAQIVVETPNLWGKGERAFQIMSWAGQQLEGVPDGADPAESPAVEAAYAPAVALPVIP